MQDYDKTVVFLGEWGRFQGIVFFLLCVSAIPNGINVFSLVFLNDVPSHHCLIPETNLSQDWLNAAIPKQTVNGKEELSRCRRYRLDVVRNLSAQGLIPGRDVNLTDLEQEGCVDGWSYSKDIYQSTIVSEFKSGSISNLETELIARVTSYQFDLVCIEKWKKPFTSMIFFLGVLCGSFFSGQVSDRFGRKPVLFATTALQTVFTFLQSFSPSWMVLSLFIFMNGLGHNSNYMAAFVLGTEILTGRVRIIFSSMGICIAFAIGYMLLPLFAYFLRDWKTLQWAISLPGLAYLPLWWLVPESPRWLLSQGRVAEAEAIVRKAANINKVEAPQVIFEDYSAHADEKNAHQKKYHNVLHLLRTRNIRNTTVILGLLWFSLTIGYYGLALHTSQLHADPYIGCLISALVEVPAYITSWLVMRYLPRRLSVMAVLLLVAVSLYFIQLVPQSLSYLSVALEMLGKFALTIGTSLEYAYTAEIYPTVLRNTATGICSTICRLGSCTAPFLLSLGEHYKYLPYTILGTLAVVSAFAVSFLPETFGQDLPQTIKEMHKLKSIKCPFITQKEQEPKEEREERERFSTS